MILALYALAVLTAALFLVAGSRLLKLNGPDTGGKLPEAEIDVARYRPMGRLLRSEDDAFLAGHGMTARTIRQFRAERRRIFRGYLRCLKVDFGSLTHAVKLAMVQADEPCVELGKELRRAQLLFAFALASVEFRLALHALGLNTVTMDVRPLIASLEQMYSQHEGVAVPSAA